MSKQLLRLIGIQIILLGFVLSVFEFLIDNSEFVVGVGIGGRVVDVVDAKTLRAVNVLDNHIYFLI